MELLSLLRILAITLVAFFVNGASPTRSPATSPAVSGGVSSFEVVAAAAAAPASSHRWSDRVHRVAVHRDAVEPDLDDELDDDDDRDEHAGVDDESASRTRGNLDPRSRGRARWAEEALDTSRFAVGPGLPRGPPSFAV